jgi:hypothetical protein
MNVFYDEAIFYIKIDAVSPLMEIKTQFLKIYFLSILHYFKLQQLTYHKIQITFHIN